VFRSILSHTTTAIILCACFEVSSVIILFYGYRRSEYGACKSIISGMLVRIPYLIRTLP
jgi:hypothetical protein